MRILAAILATAAVAAAPLQVKLTVPDGHTPKIKTHWPYTVRATSSGKLVKGTITVEVVDPLGGHHYVQLGASTRIVHNIPFKGVFRDYIIWPPASRGIPVTFRITVHASGKTKVIAYHVIPRGA
jgi:hypothetical protein